MGCSLPEVLHSPVHKRHTLGKLESDTDLNSSPFDFLYQKPLDTIVVATEGGTGEIHRAGLSITVAIGKGRVLTREGPLLCDIVTQWDPKGTRIQSLLSEHGAACL